MVAPKHLTDRCVREIRANRQRLAFAVRSVMREIDCAKVPKPRQAELDFERHLLEEAMEILMKDGVPSPEEIKQQREEASAAKLWAEMEEEEESLAEDETWESIYGKK